MHIHNTPNPGDCERCMELEGLCYRQSPSCVFANISFFISISSNLWTRNKIDSMEFNFPFPCFLALPWIIRAMWWSGADGGGWRHRGEAGQGCWSRRPPPSLERRVRFGLNSGENRTYLLWDSTQWFLRWNLCLLNLNGWTSLHMQNIACLSYRNSAFVRIKAKSCPNF